MPITNQPVNPYAYQMPGQNAYQPPQPQINVPNQFYGNQVPQMNFSSQPGLSIIAIDRDDQVNVHPVASGNTVLFVNFNTNRMCFKSTNANGVPMTPRWASFTYDEQPQQQSFQNQNQNQQSDVTRQEVDELKSMLSQLIANQGENQQRQSKQYYSGNGKRGGRNDGSSGVPANDG